jgi:hypothetical protein
MSEAKTAIGTKTQAGPARAPRRARDESWKMRELTRDESKALGFAVNAFRDPANLPADGWTLKANGAKGEASLAELRGLLDRLFESFSEQELRQRLAWILDSDARFKKLCGRLERAQELLGNGSSEHPFTLELGTNGTGKKAGTALLNNLRHGTALKTLLQTHEAWKQLHASSASVAS